MSWGTGEFFGESSLDSYFTTPAGHTGETFVAASGDQGSMFGPEWPSTSDNVLAVGGTTLNLNADGSYGSETGWGGSGMRSSRAGCSSDARGWPSCPKATTASAAPAAGSACTAVRTVSSTTRW